MRIMSSDQEQLLRKLTNLADGDFSLVQDALGQADDIEGAIQFIMKRKRDKAMREQKSTNRQVLAG